jgi:hypothetical protein
MEFFDPAIHRLESSVLYESQRAAVAAHNVANIDTPGYQRVAFSKALRDARKQLGILVEESDDYGNGEVVLEREVALLGKSKVKQASYLKLLGLQYGILKKVYSQGKG